MPEFCKLQRAERPAALLATAAAGGTIGAARALGKAGIPLTMLSSHVLSAAAWSRHVVRSIKGPSEKDTAFVPHVIRIGQSAPGMVLVPTSDQTAWTYAQNADALGQYFQLYQPTASTISTLLDKSLFSDLAVRAGVRVLPTWSPTCLDEVRDQADKLAYPILIKPRSHVNRLETGKGEVVYGSEELVDAYERMLVREGGDGWTGGRTLARPPILQRFVSVGSEGVHSVTGFIDRSGELFVTRRTAKVFLRTQPAGVGVCYEARPPSEELNAATRRLCLEAGYFGMFEVEFVRDDGAWAAIDFNPRLFNQVGLDIARGMSLPYMYWLAALGRTKALEDTVAAAALPASDVPNAVFYDRFTFSAMLLAKAVTFTGSRSELAHWRAWRKRNEASAVDVAADRNDRMPGIVHALSELGLGLKSLPRFLRTARPANSISSVEPTTA